MWQRIFPWVRRRLEEHAARQRLFDEKLSQIIDSVLTKNEGSLAWSKTQNDAYQEEMTLRMACREARRQEAMRLAEIKRLEELKRLAEEEARRKAEEEAAARLMRCKTGKMRCAICLSGFMRFVAGWHPFRDLLTHMQSSFYDLDPDIFISTWNIAGIQKGKDQTFAWRWPEVAITPELLKGLYGDRLKGFQIRPYDPKSVTPGWLLQHAPNDMHLNQRLSSMYFHVFEANRLKSEYCTQHGFQYDVVIRSRCDLNFHHGKASDIIKLMQYTPNRVFVPDCESYGFTNDQFMFGFAEAMDRVADIYTHITNKSDMILQEPAHCPVHPAEKFFQVYLQRIGVEVRKCAVWYTRSS